MGKPETPASGVRVQIILINMAVVAAMAAMVAMMWMRTLILMTAYGYEEDEGEAMMAITRTRQG